MKSRAKGYPKGYPSDQGNLGGVQVRFTEKTVKALKPTGKRQDIREDGRAGFYIRIFPSGEKSWLYLYRKDGAQRRLTLGNYPAMSLSEAHAAHENARLEVKRGGDPAGAAQEAKQQEKEADTVNQLAALYIEKHAKLLKRSWKEDQRILDKDILPTLGKKRAIEVTRRDIMRLLDEIAGRGAPIAANRTQALLRKLFNFAIGEDIVPFNPCLEIRKRGKENQKERVLSDDEIKTHWHGILASDLTLQTQVALLLQLVTAQRKGEVVAMRWDQIENDIWTIPAENAKNKKPHTVPLSLQALNLLDMVKNDSPWVFPAPSGHLRGDSISRATRRYLMRIKRPTESDPEAKLTKDDPEWFTPHDLRRTAATNMTKAGYNRLTVSKVLNHVEGGVTAIYDRHSYDKEKRQALEAWGRKLDAILSEQKAKASNVAYLNR
ncbi:MAG: tyrosine-type recombinase/integrase [Zetaproteobacteria bacterium]|nr:tyrosine-type recombinase/integrase [Zetaproteobacteria bacterium]